MIEAAAFAISARCEVASVAAAKIALGVSDDVAARKGVHELTGTLARKPYPSTPRLPDMQRTMARVKRTVEFVCIKDIVDDRLVRELDTEGFIARTFAAYGFA